MILYVLVLAAWLPIALGWTGRAVRVSAVLATALLGAAAVARATTDVDVDAGLLGLFAAVLALAGGSVVTTAVFHTIDEQAGDADPSMEAAGQILRGGTWIGVLERLAVFGSLVVGMPSGVALALAVKGLGRYPELRSGTRPATAERFIIGTLVSVLWAALCAYVVTGLTPTSFDASAF
ncbi:MAG: hypothetical protein ABWX74_11770 [Aeromicrobium sp.]